MLNIYLARGPNHINMSISETGPVASGIQPGAFQRYIDNAEAFLLDDFPPRTVMAGHAYAHEAPILTSISTPATVTYFDDILCNVSQTRWVRKGANIPPKILQMEYVPPGPPGVRHLARQYTPRHSGGACKAMLQLDGGLDVGDVLHDFFTIRDVLDSNQAFPPTAHQMYGRTLPAWKKTTTVFPRACNLFGHFVVLDGFLGSDHIVFRDPYSCTARVITVEALKAASEAYHAMVGEDWASYPACLTGFCIAVNASHKPHDPEDKSLAPATAEPQPESCVICDMCC